MKLLKVTYIKISAYLPHSVLLTCILWALVSTFTVPLDSRAEVKFRHDRDEQRWRKLEFERWLSERLTTAAEKIAPDQNVYVSAEVILTKSESRVKYHQRRRLTLENLGVTVPALERVAADPGWFENVERVEVEIIVDESVSGPRKGALSEMPSKIVNFVLPSQVQTTIKIIPDTRSIAHMIFGQDKPWFSLWPILLCVGAFLIMGGLFYRLLSRSITMRSSWPMDLSEGRNVSSPAKPQLANIDPAMLQQSETLEIARPQVSTSTKAMIQGRATSDGLKIADAFLAVHVLEMGSEGHPIDPDLAEHILNFNPDWGARYFLANEHLGTIFLNLLPQHQLATVISGMTAEQLGRFYTLSQEVVSEPWKPVLAQLKEYLKEMRATQGVPNPLLLKSLQMLGKIDPEKERIILDSLIQQGRLDLLDKVLENYFPADLVFQLPAIILKQALLDLSMEDRIEFLLGLTHEKKDRLLEALGDETDNLRSYIAYEMRRKADHGGAISQSVKRINELNHLFINHARATLVAHPEVKEAVSELVQEWRRDIQATNVIRKKKADAA